jgi:5-formyltetrahydrofolate cyclo-ligase
MEKDIREAKQALREQVRVRLEGIPAEERLAASARARARLQDQRLWKAAHSVLFYAPLPGELDVWPLLAEALSAGKEVALPRFVKEARAYEACQVHDLELDLQVGHFGIREPDRGCARLSSNRLDLVLVPGVAFDLQGRRLGRGKGYYDRLLKELDGTTCGVAFDEQVMEAIPTAPYDVSLDYVLTPTRWIEPER